MKKSLKLMVCAALSVVLCAVPLLSAPAAGQPYGASVAAVSETDTEEEDLIPAAALGYFEIEGENKGLYVRSDGTYETYSDWENKAGKGLGTFYHDGTHWYFLSIINGSAPVIASFDESKRTWTLGGTVYTHSSKTVPISGFALNLREIYQINGNKTETLRLMGCSLGGAVSDLDLQTEEDLEEITVAPGELTDPLTFRLGSAACQLTAINIYTEDVPLSDCIICGFSTEDTKGVYAMDNNGNTCGSKCFDSMLDDDVYYYTQNCLVYKEYIVPATSYYFAATMTGREQALSIDCSADLIMNFDDDGVMTSFSYVYPNLFYYGMEDNISYENIEGMTAAQLAEAQKKQKEIVEQLRQAFAEADMDFTLDEETGEIIMDNSTLFDKDSYQLSAEGCASIDEFMSIYGPVILSDDVYPYIDSIVFEGHTDSDGDYGYNKTLSANRADAVLDYCLTSEANGLTEEERSRLEEAARAKGYSCSDPVYDENGTEDKDASRRVAIKFYLDMEAITGTAQ